MTSFTSEDRKAAEEQFILQRDRITVKFLNLMDDCYALGKECDDPDVYFQLKLVANEIAKIGNNYYDLKLRKE